MTERKIYYNQTGSRRMYHFMLVHNFNEDLKSNALKRDTIQNFETSYLFFFQGLGCHKPKLANHMCLFHMEIITGKVHTLCTFIVGYRARWCV